MTDTQPTKFCKDCKWYNELYFGDPTPVLWQRQCISDRREGDETVFLVTGRKVHTRVLATDVRPNECHGEWWEEMPKPEPEPLTFVSVPLTAKTYKHGGIVRPSIFQRIKRWFG